MSAYTSSGSGNWNVAATWGGSGVPGSGDTATIATGHTVTVTASQTVGASGNSDTTAAVAIAGTGQLVISAGVTFTCKGDVTTSQTFANNSYVVMQAGSSWVWNVPSGQYYRAGAANTFGFNRFTIDGSSGSRCSMSVAGAGGAFLSFDTVAGGANIGGGSLVATYCDFAGLGDATHASVNVYPYQYSGSAVIYSVQNCTFTGCGVIWSNGGYVWAANSTMLHKKNVHSGTTNPYSCLVMATTNNASPGTGVWEISYNVFDQMLAKMQYSVVGMAGVTIKQNYLQNGHGVAVGGGAWALYDKNFVPGALDLNTAGNVTNSLFYENAHSSNPHFINLNHLVPGTTFSGNVFEHNGEYGVNGDCILTDSGTSGAVAYTISGNLYLPCAVGDTSGSLVTFFGNDAYTTLTLSHNTHCTGGEGGLAFETGSWTAGHLSSFKNNIFWATPANVGFRFKCYVALGYSTPLTQDIGAPSNVDYNVGYNLLATYADANFLSQGKGYAASWSVTPGAHDLSVNPQFKDNTRNVAAFASAYLAQTATKGAWATSTAYSAGDIVSSAVTGSYFGASYLYRCTAGHTSGSTTVPGDIANSTNWRAYWEPLSLYCIRQAIAAGTTYTGFGVSSGTVIDILLAWIMDGYAPQNAALHNAGSDGTDIGAVAYQASVPNDLGAYAATTGSAPALTRAFRRQRVLLESLARTAAVATSGSSGPHFEYAAKTARFYLNVTAASGTGGLTLRIRGYDKASGAVFVFAYNPSAITATGEYVFEIAPNVAAASGNRLVAFNALMPVEWDITVTVGDSSSYTYSLSMESTS